MSSEAKPVNPAMKMSTLDRKIRAKELVYQAATLQMRLDQMEMDELKLLKEQEKLSKEMSLQSATLAQKRQEMVEFESFCKAAESAETSSEIPSQ